MKHNYLIAILPPPELNLLIDEVRKTCSENFKVYKALRPPVHITLLFLPNMDDASETQLINSLEAARNFKPFTQKLENYDAFTDNEVVFIKALLNKEITNLYRNIKKIVGAASKDLRSQISPHITIAYRDLKGKFQVIHEYYKNERFEASFQVDHFTLLKHDHIQWNILKHYNSRPGDEQMQLDL
ncbi:MAG: 2'-5' RNA ligase family protein [Pedobacter sp.]|uniref:2'-5' RNA ligase family protein n=1 Tax=Pedobacter sp. TaxID=1411316 RepID=UPI003564CE54